MWLGWAAQVQRQEGVINGLLSAWATHPHALALVLFTLDSGLENPE